jgi:hypothetical protein
MTTPRERFLLIDVLKIMTLVAITVLHTNEFVFFKDIFPLGMSSPIWYAFSFYARFFFIGGQVLVSIIFFLFGYSGKSRKSLLSVAVFAVLGQLCLALVFQTLEWDIYAYLGVTSLMLLLPFFYRRKTAVMLFSFLLLFISPSFFQSMTPDSGVWVVLTGKMTEYNSGSWSLFPWFFLALLFYQLGLLIRENNFLKTFHSSEKFVWPLLLLASIPYVGFYYWSPIGPRYYQFAFTRPQYIFWSNFIYFVFIMRLALFERVQAIVKQSKFVNFISGLYWSRHLGLVYLLSIIYLGIGMNFSAHFERTPWIFDLFFLSLMPVSELAGRFFIFIVKLRK